MKKTAINLCTAALTGSLLVLTACDWSSGGDTGFNTSRGAGVNVNFSGVYSGTGGGRAVSQTSAGNITTLTISQGGNRVDVRDNQGSSYSGSVGSPGAVSDGADGTYPAGAEIAQAQINFSGHDNVSGKNISFAGVIHVVSVTDIQGSTSSDSSSDNYTYTENTVTEVGVNNEQVTTLTVIAYDPRTGDEVFREVTTTTVKPSGETTTETRTITDNRTSTSTTTYSLTEANSQYRLQGTWVEEGGVSSSVDALSSGANGVVTVSTAAGEEATE